MYLELIFATLMSLATPLENTFQLENISIDQQEIFGDMRIRINDRQPDVAITDGILP